MKKTRITALLLAALTLVPFFAACGEEKSKKEEVTTESALVDDYLDTALPTETYNGETLGFIGGEGTKFVPAEEENGQPVDDALLRRNAKIEERYDVELKYYPTGWGGDTNDMVNTDGGVVVVVHGDGIGDVEPFVLGHILDVEAGVQIGHDLFDGR